MKNINSKSVGDHGYVAMYNGARVGVYATSAYAAECLARDHFKPAKSKAHMVHVLVAERPDGSPVVHTTAQF